VLLLLHAGTNPIAVVLLKPQHRDAGDNVGLKKVWESSGVQYGGDEAMSMG
jgi:hypothetical protein